MQNNTLKVGKREQNNVVKIMNASTGYVIGYEDI